MHVEIITPEKQLFEGEAVAVKLPGAKGSFEILNSHAPIVSSLQKGIVVVKTKEGDQQFDVTSGFVEVVDNKVIILI